MALDTPGKRLSAVELSLPWRRSLPFPDGTLGVGDRLQLLYRYAGTASASVVVVPPITDFTLDYDHVRGFVLDFDHVRDFTLEM